jgi:predicted O-methyltransferase YrrM
MNRHDLVKSIVEKLENGIIVEIGTHVGNFADHILQHSNQSVLYCIDPYICYDKYDDAINNITGDDLYNSTRQRLTSKYGDRVRFIRTFSDDALSDIPDEIDFLYIDGNHRYDYVYQDLKNYYSRVKDGCCIVGDDAVDKDDTQRNENGDVLITWSPGCYGHYGVIKAFREFCSKKSINGKIIGDQYLIQK